MDPNEIEPFPDFVDAPASSVPEMSIPYRSGPSYDPRSFVPMVPTRALPYPYQPFGYDFVDKYRFIFTKYEWHDDLQNNGGIIFYRLLGEFRTRIERHKTHNTHYSQGWTYQEIDSLVELWKASERTYRLLSKLIFPEILDPECPFEQHQNDHEAFKYMMDKWGSRFSKKTTKSIRTAKVLAGQPEDLQAQQTEIFEKWLLAQCREQKWGIPFLVHHADPTPHIWISTHQWTAQQIKNFDFEGRRAPLLIHELPDTAPGFMLAFVQARQLNADDPQFSTVATCEEGSRGLFIVVQMSAAGVPFERAQWNIYAAGQTAAPEGKGKGKMPAEDAGSVGADAGVDSAAVNDLPPKTNFQPRDFLPMLSKLLHNGEIQIYAGDETTTVVARDFIWTALQIGSFGEAVDFEEA